MLFHFDYVDSVSKEQVERDLNGFDWFVGYVKHTLLVYNGYYE